MAKVRIVLSGTWPGGTTVAATTVADRQSVPAIGWSPSEAQIATSETGEELT